MLQKVICHNIKVKCGRHPVSQGKNNLSNPGQLQKEEKHLYQSLGKCKYPDWAINRVKLMSQSLAPRRKQGNSYNPEPSNIRAPKPYIVVPYHQGLSKSYKRICKKYGIEVHLKGDHTIRDLVMAPKNKDPLFKKSGVIYRYKCDRVDCDEEYIGESARIFEERFKEHLKAPSPIHDHFNISGHAVTIDNFSILVLCKAVLANWSDMSRGRFYCVCIWECTAIHNCSSSGSLLFATLRWNN